MTHLLPAAPPGRHRPADAYDVLRPAAPPGAASVPANDRPADPLAARRQAVLARFHPRLSLEEAVAHRRLVHAGRLAEARALAEQAERFHRVALGAVARMDADELEAFAQAVDANDGPRRYRLVAAVLRRVAREATGGADRAPVLTEGTDERPGPGADGG